MRQFHKLFRERWQDKCMSPCPASVPCSCREWAYVRSREGNRPKSEDDEVTSAQEK